MQVMVKRGFLTASLALVLVLAMSQTAFAAGWWKENPNDTINVLAGNGAQTADGLWSDMADNPTPLDGAGDPYDYNNPHGNFTTTSNRCKTCHAVHGALNQSFRLLRNVSREEECNYCHMGPTGASMLRLYALDDLGFDIKGEHTLGSTEVPDSNINSGTGGVGNLPDRGGPYDPDSGKSALYCYGCHSVHGAGIITKAGWLEKILRRDPAGNGGSADDGLQGSIIGSTLTREDGDTIDISQVTNAYVRVDTKTTGPQVKAAFCADCHTKNYNFRVNFSAPGTVFGKAQLAGKDYTLNRRTHPMNDNQYLHVGGGAGLTGYIQVSGSGFNVEWCGVCHSASSETEYSVETAGTGGDPWDQDWTVVGFPHQSKGNKLFSDGFTEGNRDAEQTNDAYEAIPALDNEVCNNCHRGWGAGVGDPNGF